MWLTVILTAILFVTLAMMVREGLWSNAITLLNTVIAALVATSLWEPAADFLEETAGLTGWTYWVDFIAIWAVFGLTMVVCRAATDFASRTSVRFKMPINTAGGILFALWTGWVLVGFTLTTLHMAPLARHSFGGAFQPTPDATMYPLAPDRQWLAFVHSVSGGSLCTSAPEGQDEDGMNVFDPRAEFIFRYAKRRQMFEKLGGGTVPSW